jgi:hypothetical protein
MEGILPIDTCQAKNVICAPPQTDGASKVSNKTVIQCIWFHVEHHQCGWVKALPTFQFEMMNTVNSSTGLSGF